MRNLISGLALFLSLFLMVSCEVETKISEVKHHMFASFAFEDRDTTAWDSMVVLRAFNKVHCDSVLRSNNASRYDLRNFRFSKIWMEYDVKQVQGSFADYSKLELYLMADSAGSSYPKFLIGSKDSIGIDTIRTLFLKTDPNFNLAKYLRAPNIQLKAVLYPKDTAAINVLMNARLEYEAKADVTN